MGVTYSQGDNAVTLAGELRAMSRSWASDLRWIVEAMGLEPTNLLTASQALYQLSYAPARGETAGQALSPVARWRTAPARLQSKCSR
jgi:hypothetical protein